MLLIDTIGSGGGLRPDVAPGPARPVRREADVPVHHAGLSQRQAEATKEAVSSAEVMNC